MKTPTEIRFWSYVDKSGDCWEWTGAMNKAYGSFYVDSLMRTIQAHRYSWMIHHGEIPKGMWVLHRCDNGKCVNPDHLFLGDNDANVADREAKGRTAVGSACGASKLTEEQVRTIRQLRNDGVPLLELSMKFGVTKTMICAIARRRWWRHI